jgi:hypothetical protein
MPFSISGLLSYRETDIGQRAKAIQLYLQGFIRKIKKKYNVIKRMVNFDEYYTFQLNVHNIVIHALWIVTQNEDKQNKKAQHRKLER